MLSPSQSSGYNRKCKQQHVQGLPPVGVGTASRKLGFSGNLKGVSGGSSSVSVTQDNSNATHLKDKRWKVKPQKGGRAQLQD